jgi:hypothetical protein
LVRRQSQPVGCFLLGCDAGQARVADVWLLQQTVEWYEAAVQLALVASLTNPTVVEVIASASTAPLMEGFQRCAFDVFRRERIMVFPPSNLPADGYDCQLLDNDMAFLSSGAPAYVT